MINQLLQVKAFMRKFNQTMYSQPVRQIDTKLARLGHRLIDSELTEMVDATTELPGGQLTNVDPVEMLDALCDILYVTLGQAHRMGLGLILPVAFQLVHESNMTKLWTNAEVQDFLNERSRKGGGKFAGWTYSPVEQPKSNSRTDPERYWLVQDEHGKAMKSPSYQAVDLSGLLSELEGQELLDYSHAARLIFDDSNLPEIEDDGLDGLIPPPEIVDDEDLIGED